MIKQHIPNCLTLLNLLCGAYAIICCLYFHDFQAALYLIIAAALFDFVDGFVARLLGVSSAIGADLDSLADGISFGLAPATYLWRFLLTLKPAEMDHHLALLLILPSLLIAAFAALRLAKFNNSDNKAGDFQGLPVPANALFWIGWISLIKLIYPNAGEQLSQDSFYLIIILSYLCLVLINFMMISNIRMYSLKMKSLNPRENAGRYILIVLFLVCTILMGLAGFSIGILYYILSSIVMDIKSKKCSKANA